MTIFPDIYKKKDELTEECIKNWQLAGDAFVRVINSPYRICPLGAHIDHQGGQVLGMTIGAGTLLAFAPQSDGQVRLKSRNYPGELVFNLKETPEPVAGDWRIYPIAAAHALQEKYELKNGVAGLLDGMLPGCGLSSSASVLLAYLYAFAKANDLELEKWEYVELNRTAENKYIGLKNGILDQSSIVFGKKDTLVQIDTRERKVSFHKDSDAADGYRLLVIFSGHYRELTVSGYNNRVDECREASAWLAEQGGLGKAERLSDIPQAVFDAQKDNMPSVLRKRAEHYFSESNRVQAGLEAWNGQDIKKFGALMNQSCLSSINSYESGTEAIHELHTIVSSEPGVYGSRFMGGGFGGCVVGLVDPAFGETAVENVWKKYIAKFPEIETKACIRLTHSDDGMRLI